DGAPLRVEVHGEGWRRVSMAPGGAQADTSALTPRRCARIEGRSPLTGHRNDGRKEGEDGREERGGDEEGALPVVRGGDARRAVRRRRPPWLLLGVRQELRLHPPHSLMRFKLAWHARARATRAPGRRRRHTARSTTKSR